MKATKTLGLQQVVKDTGPSKGERMPLPDRVPG